MKAWSKISITVHDLDLKEPIYTIQEASEYTGCSIQSLNRWHRNGSFISMFVEANNRKYRYYTKDMLDTFMQSEFYKSLPMIKNADLIHTRIGKLYIKSFSNAAIKKGYYGSYVCECDCGNIIELARSELLSGKYSSCGCKYHDLSGQTFGEWHVDNLASDKYVSPQGDTCLQYNCTCSCGTKRVVLGQSLLSGRSTSCGCTRPSGAMSKAEFSVIKYLQEHGLEKNIHFQQYKVFDDLRGVGDGYLSYDFYVLTDKYNVLIECQGGQHYFPVDLWGGEDAFVKQQKHDAMKRKYALDHNILLIEIPYTMFTYESISKLLDDYFHF